MVSFSYSMCGEQTRRAEQNYIHCILGAKNVQKSGGGNHRGWKQEANWRSWAKGSHRNMLDAVSAVANIGLIKLMIDANSDA